MKNGIRPLFKWFGSKWQAAPKYPAPKFDRIVEPFAGGAGYSLRYPDRDVLICDDDPYLVKLWSWLIEEATESIIREIPIGIPERTDIRSLGLSEGQALLVKFWQRTGAIDDCWTVSSWGNLPGQWTANTRARVAAEVNAIKHWRFAKDGLSLLRTSGESEIRSATWFVDPMYMFNYQYRHSIRHDYTELGRIAQSLPGQVIVCEAECPKTGKVPGWLPFVPFGKSVTSRRKKTQNHHSKELIWTNDG